jgi:beta-phosphoglucomutase family hydrolase
MATGVLFDMDGVLVDSYRPHLESWQALAREEELPFDREALARAFGRTSREIIATLWPDRAEDAERLSERKEAAYRALIEADFPAMPGAAELVRDLDAAGLALALASSGPPANVELALERLRVRDCFAAVVTGHDVRRGKPDPQVFLLAAERLGLPPAGCVVIEDAPVGVRAAHAAGMAAVALLSTGRRREDFAEVGPELVVATLRELDAPRLAGLRSALGTAGGAR